MKKALYMKILIAFIVVINIIFTTAVLVVFWHTGSEPSALIVAWFTFTTSELLAMAGIKIKKIKGE